MARVALLDASTGQVTLSGTVDGVNLAALNTAIQNHDHVLSGNVSTVASGNMTLTGTGAQTSFNMCNDAETSTDYQSARGSDEHTHTVGSLASDVETASTLLSAKSDGEITIDSATGDLVCDTIDGVAPEVLYDRYHGHWHTVTGSTGSTTLDAIPIAGANGWTKFRVASDSSGTGAAWETVTVGPGAHSHANSNIALSAFSYPSGAGSNDAGNPKFAIAAASGNISLKGDVNDIGIAQLKASYDAHTAHSRTGTTASHSAGQAYATSSGGKTYFQVGASTWVRAYLQRPDHSHNGTTLSVATPS